MTLRPFPAKIADMPLTSSEYEMNTNSVGSLCTTYRDGDVHSVANERGIDVVEGPEAYDSHHHDPSDVGDVCVVIAVLFL